jgi:glycosyltransferase involved in cell wall biosynthesis
LRILLLNQFYPPDVAPTGLYLHDLARELVARRHQVHVIASRRSYDGDGLFRSEELLDGVRVHRVAASGFGRTSSLGRLADYASYLLGGAARRMTFDADVVVSLTTPPWLGLVARLGAGRRIHWIMDLYPDVLHAHGIRAPLGVLTRLELAGARRVVALGDTMRLRVARYARDPVALPLWHAPGLAPWPDGEPNPLRAARGWRDGETVFMYSGNMGLGHRLGEFLSAAGRLGPSGPRWIFAGGGAQRHVVEEFRQSHPAARIELFSYASNADLRASLCSADVHLASLDSRWQGVMVPSKIQGIFAVGRPVIFVGGDDNEIAQWIRESGAGWIVRENDIDGLLAAVAAAPAERVRRGAAALDFARRRFAPAESVARLAELIEDARPPGPSAR